MTCVVVSDASCLIDLKKGRLLHTLQQLPYRFIVPLPIREEELRDFTPQEWRMLDDGGLATYDLTGEKVVEAIALKHRHGRLSINDCFALITTKYQEKSTLLTGDNLLRKVALASDIQVHGVLWIIHELHMETVCHMEHLITALEIWRDEKTVFLPPAEIEKTLHFLGENQ